MCCFFEDGGKNIKKQESIYEPVDLAYDDPDDLTPEERLERITSILCNGVLRLIEEEKDSKVARKEKQSEINLNTD